MKQSLALAVIVLAALSGRAEAQNDFATCPVSLPLCSGAVDDCCARPFDAVATDKAIVIPMDRCHQKIANGGKLSPPGTGAPEWCADSGSGFDDGMYEAYGLVYRLMQQGIPVYWSINSSKDPPALTNSENAGAQNYVASDIDFWVLSAGESPLTGSDSLSSCSGSCTPPVLRLNSSLAPVSNTYSKKQFPVRGAAFIIAAEDRPAFNAYWAVMQTRGSLWDFGDVDMYEVQNGATFAYQDFTSAGPSYAVPYTNAAPVAVKIDYAPPRLARQSPAGVSAIWLDMAKLDEPANASCKTGSFTPSTAVFCDISESDIQGGVLVNGSFQWAWLDSWSDNSPCGSAAEIAQHSKLDEFMTKQPGIRPGGHVLYMDKAPGIVESCPDLQFQGTVNPAAGLVPINQAPTEPMIIRYAGNLFQQWGDIPTEFASGSAATWQYYGGGANGYDPAHVGTSLVRLVSEDRSAAGNALCTNHKSTPACDVFANNANADYVDAASYTRHKADGENGIVFYLGGNQVNNSPSQLRMILNAPVATVPQTTPTATEVSRSSPIVADVDGIEAQYQGTYELELPLVAAPSFTGGASAAAFEFPFTRGHLRAYPVTSVSGTQTTFTNLASSAIFDAANGIPTVNVNGCATPFSASCRTVFTNINGGSSPDKIFFHIGNVAQIKPLLAPTLSDADNEILISRVLAGYETSPGTFEPRLGGIDRSTMAIIEASPLAGSTRPTMIYAGGLDGMIHAICADTVAPCAAKGQELWAFIPRTQLPRLATNTQRIDGSPKVGDVFADFDSDGTREWKTVLTFQSGAGDVGFANRQPAVIAMDVTNPAAPQILWELNTPVTRGNFELGNGLGLAMGPTRIGSDLVHLTFVLTNNGGTAGAGIRVMAYETATGDPVWTNAFEYAYPGPRNGSNPPVPTTGIPGGVAAFDNTGGGSLTDIAVPTLYGDLFVVNAADGVSRYGTGVPLFRFNSDFHPIGAAPTIFRDQATGKMHAVVVSGGYADPVNSSWAPETVDQFAVAVHLGAPLGVATMGHIGSDYGGERKFVLNLGAGQRVYNQAVVAGNELFITSDDGDVNSPTYGSNPGSGQLTRFNLNGTSPAVVVTGLAGGVGSADVTGTGVAYVGSGDSASKADFSSTFDANGEGTELVYKASSGRKLWLRLR
jgi:hypothetical protein